MTFTHDSTGTRADQWEQDPRTASLSAADPDLASGTVDRLVVVAAHPDDESLGAGGLIHRAHRTGVEVVVVVATDGEASHPASPTHRPVDLARVRRTEVTDAVHLLAPHARLACLGLPDSRLGEHVEVVTGALVDVVGDGAGCLVVAPWRNDGHTDHEAAGRAAAAATSGTAARLWEYPIWFWHWGRPDEAPWADLRVVVLDAEERVARARAQDAHRSQVAALSDRPGDEALLSPELLAHFTGPRERFVVPRGLMAD